MEFQYERNKMVNTQLIPRGIKDIKVIEAFKKVPRHMFVDEALYLRAYGDYPLPIGFAQTISQPYIVSLMVELLELKGNEKVLEIGTGSGYMTAILAEIVKKVFSIERIKELSRNAQKTLDELNYYNARLLVSDGTLGYAEEAPFDAVIVSAASPEIPRTYIEQLKIGGKIVIPIGDEDSQILKVFIKGEEDIEILSEGACRFVKLIGRHGFEN
ncbi:MAG: protein-L-isoaspartate(D-aspartate) O-methyltransferase [Pseudomonadota bacterium]